MVQQNKSRAARNKEWGKREDDFHETLLATLGGEGIESGVAFVWDNSCM